MEDAHAELISVVITCFNLERYVGDAIRSVLGQHGAGRFEVIVVDDASTDASPALIAAFPDVRCIRMPANGGVMRAMLRGVAAAQGDLVCLLDGDDVWEAGKLATVRRCFARHRAALVTHDLTRIDARGEPMPGPSRCRSVMGRAAAMDRPGLVRRGIVGLGDYVWLGSALSFRRSAVDWPGFLRWVGTMPAAGSVYQDWPLAFWIATQPECVMAYVDEPLLRYRVHGANHSGDARTPARAARNFRRANTTMDALAQVARQRHLPASALVRIASRGALYAAQALAFEGQRGAALARLPAALRGIVGDAQVRRALPKLLAAIVLGPTATTALKRTVQRAVAGARARRQRPPARIDVATPSRRRA